MWFFKYYFCLMNKICYNSNDLIGEKYYKIIFDNFGLRSSNLN